MNRKDAENAELRGVRGFWAKGVRRILFWGMGLMLALLASNCSQFMGQAGNQILWDTYGIPHIFAKDNQGLFYAFGWAQMQSHGNLILRLYGQARGQAAEYWGKDYLESDRWVHTMGIPDRAKVWYEAQNPVFRNSLDAFVAGMNAYAKEHGDAIADDLEIALPLQPTDVLAHEQRVVNFTFVVDRDRVENVAQNSELASFSMSSTRRGFKPPANSKSPLKRTKLVNFQVAQSVLTDLSYEPGNLFPGDRSDLLTSVQYLSQNNTPKGSNGWAIAPSHSDSGNALLLANPHLPWSDLFLWYEAQLTAPGIDAYGATLVGFPVLTIAFNDNLGWTHTVNAHDGWDVYELPLEKNGYRLDGKVREFEGEEKVLKVKQKDGTVRSQPLIVRRSIHGPIITEKEGKAIALRVVGIDKPGALEQWWDMARAGNFAEFETTLKRLEIPMFTVMYADREGHIMHLFNGQVPIREKGDFEYWSKPIPGETSSTLWTKYHAYEDLPRVVDPPSGWLQNANDPPWTTTFPSAIAANHYPSYMAPIASMDFRAQRSAKMLLEDEKISFEELIQYKHSTVMELADRLLDDLIPAAQKGSEKARRAAAVLTAWDRKADAESRGAVLFNFWVQETDRDKLFAKPWSENAPLTTPDGLVNPAEAVRSLEAAATKVEAVYGKLDVAWGDVFRVSSGEVNLPANGGDAALGLFRALWFAPDKSDRLSAVGGESFVAAIEFSNPVKAMALTSYGNATQPGSPHVGDQLQLFARQELRPVWRSRSDIEAHLSSRQQFSP